MFDLWLFLEYTSISAVGVWVSYVFLPDSFLHFHLSFFIAEP